MVNNKRDDIEVLGTSGLLGRIDCVNSSVQKAMREVRTQQTKLVHVITFFLVGPHDPAATGCGQQETTCGESTSSL